MEFLLNKTQVQEILDALNRTTKATVTLFDRDLHCIADAGKWQPFCIAIGKHAELLSKCSSCNHEHAQETYKCRQIVKYTCHAGIMEMVAPIIVNGDIIAYLMLGKIRDKAHTYSSTHMVKEFALQNGLDVDDLLTKYKKLPLISNQQIKDAVLFTEMSIQQIETIGFVKDNTPSPAQRIENYIEEHLSEKLTVKSLCKHFHMSSHTLYKVFKKYFNMEVKEFILKKRMDYACKALIETDKPITEIAINAGYNEYNYFLVVFKNVMGMAPTIYREKYKTKKEN